MNENFVPDKAQLEHIKTGKWWHYQSYIHPGYVSSISTMMLEKGMNLTTTTTRIILMLKHIITGQTLDPFKYKF